MRLLAEEISDSPDLRNRLLQHVVEQRAAALRDEPDIAQLKNECDDIQKQIQMIVTSLKGAALDAVQIELQRLGDRRNAIEARLHAARKQHSYDPRPVETVVDEAIQILAKDSQRLLTLPIEPLRDLVDCLITDATVDMATKQVELKIALPTWALVAQPKPKRKAKNAEKRNLQADEAVCPAETPRSQAGGWTHTPPFLSAECPYRWTRGSHTEPPCYHCRRKAA